MTERKPILEVRGLVKQFPVTRGTLRKVQGTVKAVDGVSFHVEAGETLALVGESGCGKTTTGRCILRALRPTSGQILFYENGESPIDIARSDDRELRRVRRKIRMVFQDPYSSLNPRMTVRQIVGESLIINGVVRGRRELEERVAELLRMVRLDPAYMNRYPHAFSGGQRQRVAIARALSLEPRIIVADEPVSALDVSVQAQILNLFEDLQRRLGVAYLFIAHNLAVVKHTSTRVAVMYLGKIVELAKTESLFSHPRHPYTEALLSAAPNADPRYKDKKRLMLTGEVADPAHPPPGCAFHPRCRYAREICTKEAPPLRNCEPDMADSHLSACHFADTLELPGVKDLVGGAAHPMPLG